MNESIPWHLEILILSTFNTIMIKDTNISVI